MRGILSVKGSQVGKNIGHFLVILKKGEVSPNDLTSLNIFNSKIVTTSGVVHEYRILDIHEIHTVIITTIHLHIFGMHRIPNF